MKLQGDLESIGLANLFNTLAAQYTTGMLSITSSMGEKHIVLQDATITIFADKLSHRMRASDLLIARGILTKKQLTETLQYQRKSEPQSTLEDCLIKRGFTSAERVKQAQKFQFEEAIFDLFTWEKASFIFDSDKTIKDISMEPTVNLDDALIVSLESSSDSTTSSPDACGVNLQTLSAEIARRLPEWKNMQNRLLTPYLCFKLTDKAEEMALYAPQSAKYILKLIKEGYTVETIVKRSGLGRFDVYKILIKALDDNWIFPYPTHDLRRLAAEHCIQKHFFDALNIYRRMLESAQQDDERRHLQKMIDDTASVILRAKSVDDEQGIGEAISYKAAAEQYIRRRRNHRIGFGVIIFFAIMLSGYLLLQKFTSITELSESYYSDMLAVDQAISEGSFDKAMDILDDLYKSMPNKESDTAKHTLEQMKFLSQQLDSYVTDRLQAFETMEQKNLWDAAEAGYNRLRIQYPKSLPIARINDNLSRIQAKRAARAREELLSELSVQLQEAINLSKKKQLSIARVKFQKIANAAPPETTMKKDAQAELQKLTQIEERVKSLLIIAEKELRQKHGEKSLMSSEEAIAMWPDLPLNKQAREESNRLQMRLEQARITLKKADIVDQQGDVLAAVEILRELEKQYPEFELTANLRSRIAELEERADIAQKQLKQAQTAFAADKNRGRLAYSELIKQYMGFLISQKVNIPIYINSSPQALLKINGQTIGLTPQEVELPAHLSTTLSLEKQGYQICERLITRLMPDDMEMHLRLKREIARVLNFNENLFISPPRVIADTLYVLHGSSLSAFALSTQKKLWSLEQLFDEQTTPLPTGADSPEIIENQRWWRSRQSLEPYTEDSLLLSLRSRDVLEINIRQPSVKKLLTLPVEPVGLPCIDRSALLGDRALLAIAGADGKIRGFNLTQSTTPIWEKALDPAALPSQGALAAGLAPRNGGAFVALSVGGRLASFSMIDGRELWSLSLKAPIAENNRLPRLPSERFAVLTHTNGAVSAIDFNQRDNVWTLSAQRGSDEVFSAITDQKNVYVITREGLIRKYSWNYLHNPTALWQRSLDGAAELPLLCGNLLYAVSSFGTIYAISLDDGRVIWDYRMERKPDQISLYGDYLYLTTPDGRLYIMNAE